MQKKLKRVYHKAKGSTKIRFGVVGIANTAIDFSVFAVLINVFSLAVIPANIISTTCAMVASFIFNKKAVFPGNTKNVTRQVLAFFAVTITGIWLVQTGILYGFYGLLQQVSDVPDSILQVISKAVGVAAGMVWNYFWYSHVVFRDKPSIKLKSITEHWKLVAISASIVAFMIAMVMGMSRSVWFDEGYSIMVAQRPVSELVELIKVDAHPPLYYLYLKAWGTMFGWSELSLRISSALPGALAVGFMVAILRRLFTANVAIATAPFLVLAPFLTRYNYEIRMYALVCFIGVLATWLLLKAHQSKSTLWWLAYACVVAIGMYTLYMSVVIWIAHALWLVYTDLKYRKNIFLQKQWLFYGLAVVAFLPWLPIVNQQLNNSALPPHVTQLSLEAVVNTIMLITSYTPIWKASIIVISGVMLSIVLLLWLLILIRRQKNKEQWTGVMLLVFGFLTAFAFYWYTSLPPNPPRYVERYAVHVSIFFYALVGVTVYLGYALGKRWQSIFLASTALGLMLYGLGSLYAVGNYNFQRLEPAGAKTVLQTYGCNDTTYVTSGAYGYIDMWYDFQECDFRYFQPVDLTYVGGFAPINKLNQTERVKSMADLNANRIVFIYYNDSTEFMVLDTRYELVGGKSFDGAKVRIYQRVR